jgi:acyl carrier protein
MSQPLDAQVRQIISDVLNVPVSGLVDEASPQTIENWDSVQHLNIVLALEEGLNVQLDPEDIEAMKNVGSIITLVQSKTSEG